MTTELSLDSPEIYNYENRSILSKVISENWRKLTPEQKQPLISYIESTGKKTISRYIKELYLLYLEENTIDSGWTWVKQEQEKDEKRRIYKENDKIKMEERRKERREDVRILLAEHNREKKDKIKYAIKHDKPIPNELIKFDFKRGFLCCFCGKKLTDNLSIKLGIGSDCLRRFRKMIKEDEGLLLANQDS